MVVPEWQQTVHSKSLSDLGKLESTGDCVGRQFSSAEHYRFNNHNNSQNVDGKGDGCRNDPEARGEFPREHCWESR